MEDKISEISSLADSDNEIPFQHSDDEEEYHYSSGSQSKLQFRNVISKARWNDELGMAEVFEKKGKLWVTTGVVFNGKMHCSIEETLFLMEVGALCLLDQSGSSMDLKDIYKKVTGGEGGFSWELFEVYRHLKSLGYIVQRHGVPWSMKATKGTNEKVSDQDRSEVTDLESKSKLPIIDLLANMHFNELKPIFDVYLPNSKFKKSCPGDPSFILWYSRGYPPTKAEIETVERQCGRLPWKICHVEHGRISFFSIDKVELPVLR